MRRSRNGDDDDDDDDGGGGGGGDGGGDDTDDDSQQLFAGWSLGNPQKHGDQQKLSLSHERMPHAWTDDTPTM